MKITPKTECICEICTCGRHHCPHKAKHYPKGPCVLSEYTNRYRPFPITLRESFKPKPELRGSDAPLEDKTIHRIDYVPHKLDKPLERDRDVYTKPEQPMDMTTSYNQNYTGKIAPPARAIKTETHKKPPGAFDGEPTYRADYKKWDIDPRKSYGPDTTWIPPYTKFDGLSTQRNDYPGYMEPPRRSMKPEFEWRPSSEPLNDLTDYRQSYIKHPIPPKLIREQDVYKGPSVPMDGLTTFRRDYLGKQVPKVPMCKPDHGKIGSDAPLDDMTTCRADYREWPAQPVQPFKPPGYIKPEGEFEGDTTYRNNYRPTKGDKAMSCKPIPARRSQGDFDGTTQYQTEYRKWDGCRPAQPKMRPELVVSDAPFDGISTQRAHYVGHPDAKRPKSCRPELDAYRSKSPFDDATIYRCEYTPKAVEPCPVPTINLPTSRYTYHGEDDRGHLFYNHKSNYMFKNAQEANNFRPLTAQPIPAA